jgi:hypothetical protein
MKIVLLALLLAGCARDYSCPHDLALVDLEEVLAPADLEQDLAQPQDMAVAPDLAEVKDLAEPRDLAEPEDMAHGCHHH